MFTERKSDEHKKIFPLKSQNFIAFEIAEPFSSLEEALDMPANFSLISSYLRRLIVMHSPEKQISNLQSLPEEISGSNSRFPGCSIQKVSRTRNEFYVWIRIVVVELHASHCGSG